MNMKPMTKEEVIQHLESLTVGVENKAYVDEINNFIEVIEELNDEDSNMEDSFSMKKITGNTENGISVIIPYDTYLPHVGKVYLELEVYDYETYCKPCGFRNGEPSNIYPCNSFTLQRQPCGIKVGNPILDIRNTDTLSLELVEVIGLLNELDEVYHSKLDDELF